MDRVQQFAQLHAQPQILVLPNAWDCASARIFEEAGFPAIGTTSAGIAFSLGYPDGQCAPWRELIPVLRRIASCVSIPVSADIESGYGDLSGVVQDVVAAGIVGVNLEDVLPDSVGLFPLEGQLDRIRTVKASGLFVNARTDVFWLRIGDPADRLQVTIDRAKAFARAGADCVFVPALSDPAMIERLTRAVPVPVNILGGAGVPSAPELQRIGVKRVSVGSGVMRSTMGHTQRVAQALLTGGAYDAMLSGAISFADANGLFSR